MRLLLFALLLLLPATAFADPQPLGPIWQHGRDAVIVTTCPKGDDNDEWCRGVAVRHGRTVTPLGAGYLRAGILWSRKPGIRGPDVLVRGDNGGSGGSGDLFAIALAPRLVVRKLSGERYDEVTARTEHGALRIDLPFDIEFFNGASHGDATIVPIPIRWDGDDFAVDFTTLIRPPLSPSERASREFTVRSELGRWVSDAFPVKKRLYPPEVPIAHATTPVTVRALAELMLSGNADAAHALLHRAWPGSFGRGDVKMGGEQAFWRALCSRLASHPLWKSSRLDRLPHADLIVSSALTLAGFAAHRIGPISTP